VPAVALARCPPLPDAGHARLRAILAGMILSHVLFAAAVTAGAPTAPSEILGPFPLWPAMAPGETGSLGPEHDVTTPNHRTAGGRRVARITNVTVPTLTVYSPSKDRRTGAAVLVFPGGAYQYVSMDLEGAEICEWLSSIGVTAVLVKYRVPERVGRARHAAPVQDGQRALGIVRAHAAEWGLDPKRVGVIGFSAGAHLSAALSTQFARRTYDRIDSADDLSARPDFVLLIYPAYLVVPESRDLSPEVRVSAETPPTFLLQTEDDSLQVENSLAYYAALKDAQVPAEMHLYPSGGHGYGLRPLPNTVSAWPVRAQDWLRAIGVLAPSPAP
jgi:acetyl esterase/lipase